MLQTKGAGSGVLQSELDALQTQLTDKTNQINRLIHVLTNPSYSVGEIGVCAGTGQGNTSDEEYRCKYRHFKSPYLTKFQFTGSGTALNAEEIAQIGESYDCRTLNPDSNYHWHPYYIQKAQYRLNTDRVLVLQTSRNYGNDGSVSNSYGATVEFRQIRNDTKIKTVRLSNMSTAAEVTNAAIDFKTGDVLEIYGTAGQSSLCYNGKILKFNYQWV